MRGTIRFVAVLGAFLATLVALAQTQGHAQFRLQVQPTSVTSGGEGELILTATMSPGWHIYAVRNGEFVTRTSVSLEGASGISLVGPLTEPAPIAKNDPILNETINLHEGTMAFRQKFRVSAPAGPLKGTLVINYQTCDDSTCDPPMVHKMPFELTVTGSTSSSTNSTFTPITPSENPQANQPVANAPPMANAPATNLPSAPANTPVMAQPASEVPQTEAKTGAVSWTARLEPADPRPGEFARIIFTATIDEGWHIYSPANTSEMVYPIQASIQGMDAMPLVVPEGIKKMDQALGVEVISFDGGVSIALPFQVPLSASGALKIPANLTYQACNQTICDQPVTVTWNFDVPVVSGPVRSEFAAANTQVPPQPAAYVGGETAETPVANDPKPLERADDPNKQAIGLFLWTAVLAGLGALLTPCVFPMIPITVGYFSKAKSRPDGKPNLGGALAYALGIIGTFVVLGMGMAAVVGAAGPQWIASNPWINIGLGILFLVLSLNLFGVYEIGLPAGLINKAQTASNKKGGFIAPVLMGFAFTLTSFTCTVPFVGGILVAATQGDWLRPILGMVVFGAAFAAPFFLLALFPHFLSRMPRSGEWMVDVKKYLGFIEVAAALKFISNGEIIWNAGILTREVYIAITATIFTVAAFWLFGWLKIGQESGKIGWFRRGFAIVNILFAWFWFNGLNGAPLGYLEAFPPPRDYSAVAKADSKTDIPWIEDYQEGLAQGTETGKPIFVNFTGHTCVNCRRMEQGVFPDPKVRPLFDEVVPVELYTDKPSDPQERANSELLQNMTNQVANPTYVVLTPDGQVVDQFLGYAEGDAFAKWLRAAIDKAKS
jgi:thiol:disulfide interchange protein